MALVLHALHKVAALRLLDLSVADGCACHGAYDRSGQSLVGNIVTACSNAAGYRAADPAKHGGLSSVTATNLAGLLPAIGQVRLVSWAGSRVERERRINGRGFAGCEQRAG